MTVPAEEAVIRVELPAKAKRVTAKCIDEEHGNPLILWQAMGKPDYLNCAEVEDIKKRSSVEPEFWPFGWEDGVLTIRAELGVNDVYGFVIQ